jgi:hypothetical protein
MPVAPHNGYYQGFTRALDLRIYVRTSCRTASRLRLRDSATNLAHAVGVRVFYLDGRGGEDGSCGSTGPTADGIVITAPGGKESRREGEPAGRRE